MDEQYDTVILGAGAGAKYIWSGLLSGSVAVIESHRVGGECPFVACVPSKAMLRSAEVWRLGRDPEHAALFTGSSTASEAYREACRRRDEIVHSRDDTLAAGALTASGATLVRGTGRVLRPGVVDVDGRVVGYRRLVINTGSRAHRPEIDGVDLPGVWTSDQALSTDELPDRMVVLGGGAVGIELAFLFATFGTAVTLVHRHDRLLGAEEPEASEALQGQLESLGVDVRLDERVTAITAQGSPPETELLAHLESGGTAPADRLVLATGRRASGDGAGPGEPRCHARGHEGAGR